MSVPSRHTGIGAWVNSNLYTSILCNFINFHARVFKKNLNASKPSEHPPQVEDCTNTEYTGSLGYNSVCYIISRIRWVVKEKSEQMYPVMGGKKTFRWDQRLQSFQGKIRTLH